MSKTTSDTSSSIPKSTHIGVGVIAIALCSYIWWVTGDPAVLPKKNQPELSQGTVIDAPITLVSADKRDLACASDLEFEGYHCAFKTSQEPWPDWDLSNAEIRKKTLSPYMTVDNIMFLIPGLFEDPAINERYQDDAPHSQSRDNLDRFTAQCKLKAVHQLEGVMVRWLPTGKWQGPHKVWIGEASNCQVSDP